MKTETYRIGDFLFALEWESPSPTEDLPIPENFEKFKINSGKPDYTYHLLPAEHIPAPEGKPLCVRPDLMVFPHGDGEARYLFFAGSREPYGSYQEEDGKAATVRIQKSSLPLCKTDTIFTSLLALERQLLRQDTLILHCAALDVAGRALLLSGPSGIGKSTHAGLWENYADAKQVNGDRILLKKASRSWLAMGCPICGSSGICENRTLPVSALVFLAQSPTNQGQRLAPAKAMRQCISQITANRWDADALSHVWDLAEELVQDIPVFSYSCNMEKSAIRTLQELLDTR